MYRYHKPVKLKVFTRVEQFISNEIGYLTPNLECMVQTKSQCEDLRYRF